MTFEKKVIEPEGWTERLAEWLEEIEKDDGTKAVEHTEKGLKMLKEAIESDAPVGVAVFIGKVVLEMMSTIELTEPRESLDEGRRYVG